MRKQKIISLLMIPVLGFLVIPNLEAQFDPHDSLNYYDKVFFPTDVDTQAIFPGGNLELIDYLNAELEYPINAREFAVEGEVRIAFTVMADGSITDTQILKSLRYGCDEEVIRVVNAMPRWQPAILDNIEVATRIQIAVEFRLML